MKLLVVDDESSIREGLVETIDWRSIGIDSVSSAKNGIEAMKYIRQSTPDILLTDIRMPGMDGLELAECVSRLYPKTKILLLSGYTDFSYAKQAISIGVKEYLVKPVNIDDLIDRVRMTVEEIKHSTPILQTSNDFSSTIKKLLKDPNLVKEELALFIHSAGFRWNQPYLLTSLVELLPYDPLDEAKPAPLDLTEITDALSHSYPIEVFWMPGNKANQILLFFNLSSASDSSSVQETASNFIDTFCQKYNQQSTIAFSDMFSAYSFQSALRDAEKTLQYRFFIGNGVTLTSQQFSKKQFEHPISPDSIRGELTKAIRSVNIESCLHLLHPLFQSYRFSDITDIKTIQNYCFQLVSMLSVQIDDRVDVRNNLLNLGYIQYVKHFSILEEYIHQVEFFYCDILAIIKQNQPSKSRWIIKRAKDFMNQNYTLPLSVEQIAQQVERSPSYLCHIFNSIEGIPITEYLNKLRVQKAKELLRGTSMMSYEIAEYVGFKNYRYFTQVFKKYTGNSPTHYRNIQGNN
ncbi:response regulator transcription factor [Massiliimalia massiliensis]|uniref:response regulator transcription factor n=1 Tax=Massiliimalia massiliensis TaxID=1852384 RepID=UPI000985AD80|nr:response regulator [Massiliimalia massiliensis]